MEQGDREIVEGEENASEGMVTAKLEARPGQLNFDGIVEGSRSIDNFEKIEIIGEGTYGQVWKARDKGTGEIVALKKLRLDNEKQGFPTTAIREIRFLRQLDHVNVVKLKEVVTSKGLKGDETENGPQTSAGKVAGENLLNWSIFMVFEYMDHDLAGLLGRPGIRFTVPQVKCYVKQLLTGIHCCHFNGILHRDLKAANILIDNKGILKIADFGLAQSYAPDKELTNRVITLWYRPPELLLGSKLYTTAVDMWSVGCIFADLLYGRPILQGKTEADQMNRILELCGSYDELNWPGVSKLPHYEQFRHFNPQKSKLRDTFKSFDVNALNLVEKLLTMDPSKRITAKESLDADYFWTDPLPSDPSDLPQYETSHEFQTVKKRQQQGRQEELVTRRNVQHQEPHRPPVSSACPPGPPNGRGIFRAYPVQGPPYPHQQQQPYGSGSRGGLRRGGPNWSGRQSNRGPNWSYSANNRGPMPVQGGAMPGAPFGRGGQVGRHGGCMGPLPGPSQEGRGRGPR